jgi:hypothetical protein
LVVVRSRAATGEGGNDLMDPLAWALRSFLSQDVARSNAAAAAARLLDRRQEHADVDAYLAQRLDVPAGMGTGR